MYLIDTDVLVHLLRGNAAVVHAVATHADDFKAFSAVSFGELIYGCSKSDHPAENIAKVRHLAANLPIIPVSEQIMERYGVMKADLVKQGRKLEDFDLVIAATALHLGYTLVTENVHHFERVAGLQIENWTKRRP
jgi:tRNA(fMet)-specific endonuclease VapC